MIIRSVAAAGIGGLILPRKGCAELGPLSIKASAGAAFNCPIYRCASATEAAKAMHKIGARLIGLDLAARDSVDAFFSQSRASEGSTPNVFVLGSETDGVSPAVQQHLDQRIKIPMHNRVESLNVAITAALISFA